MPAHLDEPGDTIDGTPFRVVGWVAGASADLPVALVINGRPFRFRRIDRPELRAVLGHFPVSFGIAASIDVGDVIDVDAMDRPQQIEIMLEVGGEILARTVTLGSAIAQAVRSQLALRRLTRQWVLPRLRCPTCRSDGSSPAERGPEIVCPACGARFPQAATRALDLRDAVLRARIDADRSGNISSNPYEESARHVIERVTGRGGTVLDCGAGARGYRTPRVVNVEIEDYRSTDVLSAGESLPFQTDSFDAAVSLAVLEHVRDPFACARELLRVVKPGGEVVCSVPFLQPVHGFPSHYFNMTREGLATLFADGEIIDCFTPLNGHPALTLQWFAREYLDGLPAAARAAFGRMTLAQAAALPFPESYDAEFVHALSPEATRTLACLNTIVVRKRSGSALD